MSTYTVTLKSTGVAVYRYSADAPVEWQGMGFDTHDHTPDAAPDVPNTPAINPDDWRIYVGPFFDRFGAWKLPILASADLLVQAVIKDCTVRKYIHLVDRRAELLQVIGLLQSKGFAVDAAAILDVQPNAEEVFHGY